MVWLSKSYIVMCFIQYMCEHDEYEMIGTFPENMEVDGECMTNKIKCSMCGKIGTEYYSFVERSW